MDSLTMAPREISYQQTLGSFIGILVLPLGVQHLVQDLV